MRRIPSCCLISALVLLIASSHSWAGYTADITQIVGKAEPWPAQIAISHTDPVTKALYLQTAQPFIATVKSNTDYWLKQPKPYANIGFNIGNAGWLVRQYQLTGDEATAETAVKCLEQAHRLVTEPQTDPHTVPGWDSVRDLYWIDRWLAKSPAYTPQARQWVRDIALRACPNCPVKQLEYGDHNRTVGAALMADCLLALVPNAPDADKWRTYADTIWNTFWQARDTEESSEHYCTLWFRFLLDWVEVRHCQQQFWTDPAIKRMMERFLYQVLPMGAFPHYSDSTGWNVTWGHWVWIYEACATAYHDGRYKWAAHRVYDYGFNRIEKLTSWGYTGEEAAWSMVKANLVADDTIAEQPRDKDVVLLQRHLMVQRPWEQIRATPQWFDIHPEMTPDKLVFTSGPDRDGLAMLVDVVPNAGHSHNRRPTILTLVDHQSVLLMSLGYMERRAEDHNIPVITDYDGYPYDNTEYHITNDNSALRTAVALDAGPVGYGLVQLGKYQGYPAKLDREFLFIKNVGVLVKDALTLDLQLKLRWGSIFHARNLGPDHGDTWVNSYLGEWIPLRGLGVNAPVLTRWRNSPRDLLIAFAPDPNGTLEIVDESPVDKTLPLPLRVEYTLRETAQPNTPVCTTALLLPHAPGVAGPLAAKVKYLRNTATCTVVEFTDPAGAVHLAALNRTGAAISVAGLQTDAQVAYVGRNGGKITSVALIGGKQLLFNGQNLAPQAAPVKANVVPVN